MSGSGSNSVVYVGRLSSRTRERDLEDAFSKYGRIIRLDMKAGYAFIEYNDSRDADDAVRGMDGNDLDGARISVEPSHRGEGRCFACGKEGHWARDCREGPRGGGGGRMSDPRDRRGGGGPARACYTCGEQEQQPTWPQPQQEPLALPFSLAIAIAPIEGQVSLEGQAQGQPFPFSLQVAQALQVEGQAQQGPFGQPWQEPLAQEGKEPHSR